LFQAKYGKSLEACEDEGDVVYETTGVAWSVSVGRCVTKQREAYHATADGLKDSMSGIQALYHATYGCTLQDIKDLGEAVIDVDGTSWAVSVGRGAAKQWEVYGWAKGRRDDTRLPAAATPSS
jgi:hypothetical protein